MEEGGDSQMKLDRSRLRCIPAVDALLQEPELQGLLGRLAHHTVVGLVREVLAETRRDLLSCDPEPDAVQISTLVAQICQRAESLSWSPLRRVINATGILVHTNLGRAPLSASAQQGIADILGGYCNLEMDLETGKRISRLGRVRDLLVRVTGAEDGIAVNNNAAAVFLALHVLTAGREVIVSRGELVEIGGSFRLPDVMEASGSILREVGTTNRTRLEDYQQALSERSAMMLKVHSSNFLITGYTAAVATAHLAHLAHEHGLLMMEDLGSGALDQHPADYLSGEPRVQEVLRAGADLVSFSGDKLLGGTQAGLLLGRADLIDRLRQHPLARVLRTDKLHLAALEATLIEYLSGAQGCDRIPLYRMMRRETQELREQGEAWIATLSERLGDPWSFELLETEAAVGGGSLPGRTIPSVGLAIWSDGISVETLARFLRRGVPAIVGRIKKGRLVLDLRAILEEELEQLPGILVERLQTFSAANQIPGREDR